MHDKKRDVAGLRLYVSCETKVKNVWVLAMLLSLPLRRLRRLGLRSQVIKDATHRLDGNHDCFM
jgi:hypothetical protein